MTIRDISGMLEEGLGIEIKSPILVRETDFTYPIKDDNWENWFSFFHRALQRLDNRQIRSFAAVGTGSGADAIGALYALPNLETLVITDIDERVVPIAEANVRKYSGRTNLVTLAGSLCQPLKERGIKVDLIYENLPNISDAGHIINGYRRASRYKSGSFDVCDDKAKLWLLESHLAALIDAREALNPNGSVICSIGGRVPYDKLRYVVESAGYNFGELIAGLKIQTEQDEVVQDYAKAENENVTFDFYKYDEAVKFLKSRGMKHPFIELNGEELKNLLKPYRISAKEALELYRQNPQYRVGHTVHMIRAIKQ